MHRYKVPNLTADTPQPERTRLLTALRGVHGVEGAMLIPESSEFTVSGRAQQQPKRAEVESAASKAGFTVTQEPASPTA
jgi:hypothetical protein